VVAFIYRVGLKVDDTEGSRWRGESCVLFLDLEREVLTTSSGVISVIRDC
jgi:hypothetical protein